MSRKDISYGAGVEIAESILSEHGQDLTESQMYRCVGTWSDDMARQGYTQEQIAAFGQGMYAVLDQQKEK
jgi:hypothetical protein